MTTLGERIKLVRGSVSRDRFAPMTGISKTALVNYENNERDPSSEYLNKILDVFPEINPTWLLTGEGEMRRQSKSEVREAAPRWGSSEDHPASKNNIYGQEAIDLELMEVIITEVVRHQREAQEEPALIEMLARQTASTILNAYKVCHDLSLPASREVIRKFMGVAMNIYDKAMDKEKEG